MNKKRLLSVVLASVAFTSAVGVANAQNDEKGRLSGSFETNTIYYIPDSEIYNVPEDRIGTNNYLKLDYTQGRLAIGVEYEVYAPVLYGYDVNLKGTKLSKYATWTDKNFNVTVGNFFEQFGSGMILRAYEDRALGFNNSLEGARVGYNYNNIFKIRGFVARPRLFMDVADVMVRGLDASLSISDAFGWSDHSVALEGSLVSRYEKLPNDAHIGSPNTVSYSARVAYENNLGIFARAEYVERGPELVYYHGDDIDQIYDTQKGRGFLAEFGYNGNGLGVTGTLRKVNYMSTRISFENASLNNLLNYIPLLTRQNTYMLTNFNPFQTPEDGSGEQGGMIDVFYNFKKGTFMGGRYGMKVHLNGSLLYSNERGIDDKYDMLYSEVCLDVEKQWDKQFKTSFLYMMQKYDAHNGEFDIDHIFVADMLYKFNSRNSLRWELQHLYSDGTTKNWAGVLVEANFAPKWSIFASDMYNYNNEYTDDEGNYTERVHYYSIGASFTQARTRVALSYGRNRAGYICSGGVCRTMPAFTGFNLSVTMSF